MSTNKILVVASIWTLGLTGLTFAQRGPIGENILVKPKMGQESQWEEAYKEHIKWHEGIHDKWGWSTYQMMSGESAGQYFVRTGGHQWKDFDDRGDLERQDSAHYFQTAGKHTESAVVWFDRTHRDLSRIPEGGGSSKVLEFTRVFVKPAMVPKFMGVMGKFHAAFEKTNSPMHYAIAQTETGGDISHFVFVGLHQSYASLEQPPDAMPKMMEQVYGGMQAAGIFDEFWECVDRMESYIAVRRDDLSYQPPSSTSNE